MKISYNILAIARSLAETLSFNETHSPNLASTTQAGRSCLGIPGLWRLRQVINMDNKMLVLQKPDLWLHFRKTKSGYIWIWWYIYISICYYCILYILYCITSLYSYSFWVGGVGMEVDFSPFKHPINGWEISTGLPQLPHDGLRNLIWDL